MEAMLVAVSAMHGRHALSRVWAQHVASLGFDIVSVVCSRGDIVNMELCGEFGFHHGEMDNDPLAGKFNRGLHVGYHEGGTRFMILPSDDFISPAWVEAARNTKHDYIVPHDCGIYDLQSGQAYHFTRLSLTPGAVLKFGAGRVVSRKAVEACDGELWPAELTKGLDSASHNRLFQHGIRHHVVETPDIPITDVKTEENLWPFNTWRGIGTRDISEDDALHMLSPETRAELLSLRR